MPLPIYLDPSFSDALTMYGGDTVPYEALVWQRFVVLANIDTSQPITDAERSSFRAFLKRYQAWDLGVPALTSSIGESSDYQKYYDLASSLFSQMQISPSIVELRDMWRAFLISKGYTSPPPASVDFTNAFSAYIEDLGRKAISYDWSKPIVDPEEVPQIQLWNRFLEISGASSTDQPSADLKEKFSKFLQRYNIWRVTSSVLKSTNTIPPPSDPNAAFFSNYLNAFYGDLSTTEKTDLWNAFLLSQSLTSNPSNLLPLQEKFVSFINSIRSREQAFETSLSVSPKEAQSRMVLDNTMSSLRSMLLRSQDIVSTFSAALMMYGKWQKEYTTMMNKVPTISAVKDTEMYTNVNTTLRIPADDDPTKWNLADYTFGYGKVSLDDVVNWAVTNLMDPKLPQGNTITWEIPQQDAKKFDSDGNVTETNSTCTGTYTFKLVTDSATGKKSVVASYSNALKTNPTVFSSAAVPIVDANGSPLNATDVVTAVETAYKQVFKDLFTNVPDMKSYLNGTSSVGFLPALQGRYLAAVPRSQDSSGNQLVDEKGNPITDSTEIQKRTEQNATLQQYIEGIRSHRDALQTQMQQLQNVLGGSRDSIDAISDLWTSIIEAMDTIVRAIFKRGAKL